MAGKMRSFRFDDDAAWDAAQKRAKAESRAFGDALGDLIRAYAAGLATALAAASPEVVMTTARQAAQVVMTQPVAEPAVMTPAIYTPPVAGTAPSPRSGYACCKHCRHGGLRGHVGPCTQGCG